MSSTAKSNPETMGEEAALPCLAISLRQVRSALEALAGETGGEIDLVECRQALDVLERMQTAFSSTARLERRSRRNDVGSRQYVAVVGIDRLRSLRHELEPTDDRTFMDELTLRLRSAGPTVELGRVGRSSVELSFRADDRDAAQKLLEDLRRDLERPISLPGHPVSLEVAIGFAGPEDGAQGLDALVEYAEHALATAQTRNLHVAAFTESDLVARTQRLALMKQLRHATTNNELFVCYQPKLCLRTSAIEAAEVLVRWRHPVRGLVPPDEFIPMAEEGDEIRALTEFVIRQSMIDRDILAKQGFPLLINVNISGQLISDKSFAAWALDTLAARAGSFGFEITETAIIANPDLALAHIRAFADAGIAIAIDDYGSGLSSLSYLKQIPAHELKIDKAFVTGLTSSHRDPLLVRSTIDLAHALDMKVTAEGVDNNLALALLQVMGCDTVQGYHVSKPLVLDRLVDFLTRFTSSTYEKPHNIRAVALGV
jgi:EAL domain-containing protein (putative c-di-GMP-specific phosphodiesterase class I)